MHLLNLALRYHKSGELLTVLFYSEIGPAIVMIDILHLVTCSFFEVLQSVGQAKSSLLLPSLQPSLNILLSVQQHRKQHGFRSYW